MQYPNDKGSVEDYRAFIHAAHGAGALVAMATDLLALTLLSEVVSLSRIITAVPPLRLLDQAGRLRIEEPS